MAVDRSNLNVFFSCGCAIGGDTLVLGGGVANHPDAATSIILIKIGEDWRTYVLQGDSVISIEYYDGQCFILGEDGAFTTFGRAGQSFSWSEISGSFIESLMPQGKRNGSFESIKYIDGHLYACGWGGQVYKYDNNNWMDFFSGILVDDDLLNICGGGGEIYCFGMRGIGYHYIDDTWEKIHIPTNVHINSSWMRNNGKILLAGNKGVLCEGQKNKWSIISNDVTKDTIWSITEFSDKVFFSTTKNLFELKNDTPKKLKLPKDVEYLFNNLVVNRNQLWSVGEIELLCLENGILKIIPCPENQ